MIKISVLMSVYKEPIYFIKKSVESIINQDYSNFELIIILDDPNNLEAKKYFETLKNLNNIKIVINDVNRGLVFSLNRALTIAEGDFIARMDADDISDSDRLSTQLDYLQKNNLDLVGAEIRRINSNDEVISEETNKSYSSDKINDIIGIDNCIAHPTWLAKKIIFDDLNGYRDIKYCEDYDFLLRAKKRKYKFGIVDKTLFSYRINENGISKSNSLKQFLSSYFLEKNYAILDDINQDKIDNYLRKKIKPKAEAKFSNVLNKYLNYLELIKKKNVRAMFKLLFLPFQSRFILIKIKKLLQLKHVKA